MEDLDAAIVVHREALDLCLPGHANRSIPSNNFAVDLSTWYDQLGAMTDLDDAIGLD